MVKMPFSIEVPGTELKEILQRRVTSMRAKVEKIEVDLKKESASIVQEVMRDDAEMDDPSFLGSEMPDDPRMIPFRRGREKEVGLRRSIHELRRLRKQADSLSFIESHVDPSKRYEMNLYDLQTLGIISEPGILLT